MHARRLLVSILLVAGCGGGPAGSSASVPGGPTGSSPSAAATGASSFVATAPPTPAPTIQLPDLIDLSTSAALKIEAKPSPDFAIIAGGFLYVSGVEKGIGKFDGKTGRLLTSFSIPFESCEGMDAGFGAAWSATCVSPPGLVRIDTATDLVTPIELGSSIPDSEASVGVGEGGVWIVIQGSPPKLVKVNPATNKVAAQFDIPGSPKAVRAGLGAIWVSEPAANQILRVDPASGQVVATIKVGIQPQFIAVGAGALWTMDQRSGTVSRVDPATNTVAAIIELGETVQGGDIAVGGGYVWLRGSRTLLFKIDPGTNEIIARYGPSSGSGSMAADDSAVWISAHDVTTIWRLPLP